MDNGNETSFLKVFFFISFNNNNIRKNVISCYNKKVIFINMTIAFAVNRLNLMNKNSCFNIGYLTLQFSVTRQ